MLVRFTSKCRVNAVMPIYHLGHVQEILCTVTKKLPDYDLFAAFPVQQDTFWPRDCWSPMARIEIVMQRPQKYSATLGLLRWPSATERRAGFIGGSPAPPSSVRLSSSGREQPYRDNSWPVPTISNNAKRAALIALPYERWHLNGYV